MTTAQDIQSRLKDLYMLQVFLAAFVLLEPAEEVEAGQ